MRFLHKKEIISIHVPVQDNYVSKPLHQRVMTMPHYDQPLVAMATVKM